MTERTVYDYAIVGAGVSGLTLAWLLAESPLRDRSILLIDGVRDDDELRTLSFWTTEPTALDPIVAHRWRTLRFHDGTEACDLPLGEHTYQTLYFADLQRETKKRLGASRRNRVIDGRLETIQQDGEGATLVVAGETLRARWVFDSRFRRRDLEVDLRRHHSMKQHFHGWIVRSTRDVFEPAVATWLDFRADTTPGTGFFYVLPISPREALVELVTLAPVAAEPQMRDYLSRAFGLDDAELLAEEAGVSPMTEQPFRWHEGARVRRIGIAAGMLKPSSGYALTRIVDDCTAIVASLVRDEHPLVPPRRSWLYGVLDAILLEVWSATPDAIPAVFSALLRRNPIDRVLRFLDERATLVEILSVGIALPKRTFVVALGRWLARRLGVDDFP